MELNVMLAYIPLIFVIVILIYSSVFESSVPYRVELALGLSCIMLLILSALILFGVIA